MSRPIRPMTASGAYDALPSVPARVGLLNRQPPTLGPGDWHYSSCPNPAIAYSQSGGFSWVDSGPSPTAQKCIAVHRSDGCASCCRGTFAEVITAWIGGKPPERTLSEWPVPENYHRGSRSVTVRSGDALSRRNQEEACRDDGEAGGI
jgi:hypothetical protein